MALVLDATAGGSAANSYVTLANAITYFEARVGSTVWDDAETADQEESLAAATARLDQETYDGEKVSTTQRLKWPRSGLVDEDGNDVSEATVPREVQDATCELALALLTDPTTLDANALAGYSSLTIGPLSLQPRAGAVAGLPPAVQRLLARWRLSGNRLVRG
jgi:hypothetical protein